ncbi:MAG: hypothetical protein Q7T36_05145 [Fluviicoccus sp.]|uniref:hypothetical protein n=1 Tax=Fluviicoccus sp. TaxID=2003552 RepID=UPI00272530BD|nr:hypothetical protein [Fluviicoccus sp.]MDO8329840.1 hypothetical protein [Fluviicoccus sp.]
MATKEDILEQLVEEYLLHQGYFVRHNLKFLPRRDHPDFVSAQDSNHSDIDVIGYHPLRSGADRVLVVSCKSWQSGFDPAAEIRHIEQQKVVRGREAWRSFRELVIPKWSEAFLSTVESATGQREFTYVLAVTKVNGDRQLWETKASFREAIGGNPIKVLDLRQMLDTIAPALSTTLAGTEVGRMLQLFKAAGFRLGADN